MSDADKQEPQRPEGRSAVENLTIEHKDPSRALADQTDIPKRNGCAFTQRFLWKLRRKPSFVVEVVALVFLILYTSAQLYQSCAIKKSSDATVATVRAWLVPIDNSPPPISEVGPSAKFPIKIKNSGQTPAMDLKLTEQFKFWDGPLTETRGQFGRCPASGVAFFYGALSSGESNNFDQFPMNIQLTSDQMNRLASRQAMILVHVCVKYRTISGDGLTDYCIIAYGPGGDPYSTAPCYPKSLDLH
jgi:hypothetical protein